MGKKFYITTTLPYVNAPPHLGHALEFVQADILARYHRDILKEDTYFLAGTDENAIKNVQAADLEGIPVANLVERNSGIFRKLLKKLDISIDDFIRTTEPRHFKAAQTFWAATKKEDIYKKTYSGLYCVGCEAFYKSEELDENGECFEHPGRKLEVVEEENYFFKLTNYKSWLRDIISGGELRIIPDKRKNEVLVLVEKLDDFSISRPTSRSKKWGVPVPGDDSQTMYVWYDALVNYISALGYPDDSKGLLKTYWLENENRIHILGKGVSRFHTMYWPAMLKSVGLPIPTLEFVHGYITINGQKMSKTMGNVIDPFEVINMYGADAFRYWAAREISTFEDGDFTWEKFRERYNADLANGLGNLTSRIMKMSVLANVKYQYLHYTIKDWFDKDILTKRFFSYFDKFDIQSAANLLWSMIANADGFIQRTETFKKIKSAPSEAKKELGGSVEPWHEDDKTAAYLLGRLHRISLLIAPLMPETSEKILEAIKNNFEITTPLFPRK